MAYPIAVVLLRTTHVNNIMLIIYLCTLSICMRVFSRVSIHDFKANTIKVIGVTVKSGWTILYLFSILGFCIILNNRICSTKSKLGVWPNFLSVYTLHVKTKVYESNIKTYRYMSLLEIFLTIVAAADKM